MGWSEISTQYSRTPSIEAYQPACCLSPKVDGLRCGPRQQSEDPAGVEHEPHLATYH
jgi:hypothetical protein